MSSVSRWAARNALNTHEWWLLYRVGLRGGERGALLAVLIEDGHVGGDVDYTAQVGGFDLAKRSVVDDVEPMFNRLISRSQPPIRKVVYGHRRYRRAVMLAAALRHAGVTAEGYRRGMTAGATRLQDFVKAEKRRS